METKETAAVLNALIETLKDGQEGYHLAAEATKTPEIRRLLTEYSTERGSFATELQLIVHRLGEEYETEPSTVGGAHRTWINLKTAITSGDDHAVLAECDRGDSVAVAKFRDVLAGDPLPPDLQAIVARQAAAVEAAHARMQAFQS